MGKKTILFYGGDGHAAKERVKEMRGESPPEIQVIQAEAYNGERLEADEIEFMDDVDEGLRARVESLWGKFDNRQPMHAASASIGGYGERTPASDRRNLNPETRVDNPAEVEQHLPEILDPKDVSTGAQPSDVKATGLDQTTGHPATDRTTIPRASDDKKGSKRK
jgi:hypothetical protein